MAALGSTARSSSCSTGLTLEGRETVVNRLGVIRDGLQINEGRAERVNGDWEGQGSSINDVGMAEKPTALLPGTFTAAAGDVVNRHEEAPIQCRERLQRREEGERQFFDLFTVLHEEAVSAVLGNEPIVGRDAVEAALVHDYGRANDTAGEGVGVGLGSFSMRRGHEQC
jgi:hypothetical protein